MIQILVATHNQGKLKEYREMLGDLGISGKKVEWVSLSDLNIDLDVEETGASFEENARLKVESYAKISGLLTLADDSGLEVDALGGEPGIYSARYGGGGLDDAGRYRLILEKLAGLPDSERSARFRCVIAIYMPSGEVITADGTCEGRIAHEPKGDYGFGYDPIFYVSEKKAMLAELPPDVKHQISHRGNALAAIRPTFEKIIADL